MKICTKDDIQTPNEATIHIKISCEAEQVAPQPMKTNMPSYIEAPTNSCNPSLLLIISNFVHSLGVAAASFFLILAIGFSDVSITSYSYSTKFNARFHVHYEPLIPVIVFSSIALAAGILSLLETHIKRRGKERLFSGISRVAIATLSLACSIIILMANW